MWHNHGGNHDQKSWCIVSCGADRQRRNQSNPFKVEFDPMAIEVRVPDIGDYQDIPVIDILVKVGDVIAAEDALITLESDKATMDIPAPQGGKIASLLVKNGDKVSQGSVILLLEAADSVVQNSSSAVVAPALVQAPAAPAPAAPIPPEQSLTASTIHPESKSNSATVSIASSQPVSAQQGGTAAAIDISAAHASPSVRRFARELGVDLNQLKGSGPKERITEEDVKSFVKNAMQTGVVSSGASAGGNLGGMELLPWPTVDFAKFGPVDAKPLSRIKKISGANLHRNWVRIPHVTNHDEADITDLEALRNQLNTEYAKAGVKFTALAFMIKAATVALKQFPEFNASLDGDQLVYKRYFHIGFAADTPNGLVVPVLKNADQKGIIDIAKESSELASKAREGKLGPADMQGGCFSISSLGGIGGGHFTPIINAPEVAILGVGRSVMKPVWNGESFEPRLMLPLSLSYDHRVIDGALAARFNALMGKLLADMRRALL
jgi:pyruvate dehydrogenase E2 component (dihydrolipoamide acetyltransferase)